MAKPARTMNGMSKRENMAALDLNLMLHGLKLWEFARVFYTVFPKITQLVGDTRLYFSDDSAFVCQRRVEGSR